MTLSWLFLKIAQVDPLCPKHSTIPLLFSPGTTWLPERESSDFREIHSLVLISFLCWSPFTLPLWNPFLYYKIRNNKLLFGFEALVDDCVVIQIFLTFPSHGHILIFLPRKFLCYNFGYIWLLVPVENTLSYYSFSTFQCLISIYTI